MGIMTMYAEEIGPLSSFEKADPFSMNPRLPIAINIAMALTAQPVRFGKIDGFPIGKLQLVTVAGIMTIKAPSLLFRVMQDDGGVFVRQFPLPGICFKPGVAVAAGKDSLGEGGRRNGKLVMRGCRSRGAEADCYQ
jgi:hypothetical protein